MAGKNCNGDFSCTNLNMKPKKNLVIAATTEWLEKVVIGLNLCPFAKAVHVKNQIRYVVSNANGHKFRPMTIFSSHSVVAAIIKFVLGFIGWFGAAEIAITVSADHLTHRQVFLYW